MDVVRVVLTFLLSWATCAPGRADEPSSRPASISARIAALVGRFRAETGSAVGVHVIDLTDGSVLCDIQSARPLSPASNQKILTAAVALKRLGPDFHFRTTITLAGRDLVVRGDGDPTTGDARLASARNETIYAAMDRWAAALKRAGVRRIKGNLLIDASIFQGPFVHPDWPTRQLQRWYAAPVAGVNFNDNCMDIRFVVAHGRARAVIQPLSRYILVDNRVKVGRRHLWHCRFDQAGTSVTLTGTVRRTTPDALPVAVPDPPALFGCVLADRLARAGIGLAGRIVVGATRPVGPVRLIAEERTPLADALRRAEKDSLNMMAECILLRSAAGEGRAASWQRAARLARTVLIEDYGLDGGQFSVSDGSGLSRKNRASPAVLTRLLRALVKEPTFVRSLAVAGTDGSMRRRLRGPCRGRVLAKTGSLAGISALSGYVLDRAGRPALTFSVLTNGRTYGGGLSAKVMEDRICRLLVRAVDARGPARPAAVTTPPGRRRSPRPGP